MASGLKWQHSFRTQHASNCNCNRNCNCNCNCNHQRARLGVEAAVPVGRLCARLNIPHLVNHAYGLQASGLCGVLNEACRGWPPPPKHSAAQRPPPEEEAAGAAQGEGTFAAAAAAEGGGGGGAPAPASRVDAWVSSTDRAEKGGCGATGGLFLGLAGGAVVGGACRDPHSKSKQHGPKTFWAKKYHRKSF